MQPKPRVDVPQPGRTLASTIEPLAKRLRATASAYAAALGEDSIKAYTTLYWPRDADLRSTPATRHDAAWAVIGTYLAMRSRGGLRDLTPRRAEELFFDGAGAGSLVGTLPADLADTVDDRIASLDDDVLRALMPYLLETLEPGTRRSVLRDPDQAHARSHRRRSGIYYTPADVAEYMVGELQLSNADIAVLDPACGSGVFLRAAGERMFSGLRTNTLELLYGVDIDASALDAASFVLTVLARPQSAVAPWQLWHAARLNLAERDSLRLASATQRFEDPGAASVAQARNELRASILRGGLLPPTAKLRRGGWEETVDTLFPERGGAAWHVVGNPPYAPLGPRKDLHSLMERFTALAGTTPSGSTNAFIPFTELMWALSRSQGSAAYIVPLSIAYNTGSVFRSLRKALSEAGGRWTFRFFDRTPDSLFGDDIKQRVAIITREPAGDFVVRTSGLMRWTSTQRHKLFADLPPPVEVPKASIVSGIPKIGSRWELSTYEAVRSRADRLSECLIPGESAREMSLAVGATAYNQLTLYRDGIHEANGVDVNVYATASPDQADWAFAILSSSLLYWLWRVEGDGFHVPARWVLSAPFAWSGSNPDQRLAVLGKQLWGDARQHPINATNTGRQTVSFRAVDHRLIDKVDTAVIELAGLKASVTERLRSFRSDTIAVGRE